MKFTLEHSYTQNLLILLVGKQPMRQQLLVGLNPRLMPRRALGLRTLFLYSCLSNSVRPGLNIAKQPNRLRYLRFSKQLVL